MSLFSNLFGTKEAPSDKIKILDPIAYATAVSGKKVQLVDVRTAREYRSGHIKNALNIDFFDAPNFSKSFEKLDKNKPVYLYCRSGSRSKNAARKLLAMGFSEIFDLKGGYLRWNNESALAGRM
jgi:rhodanese-related sulfurtransferase